MPQIGRYELLRSRLERFTRMLPGVETAETGAVHRMRVASRRLRELLPILQLQHGRARKLGRRLRRATRRLGSVREHDVLTQLLDELRDSRRLPDRALKRVADLVRQERDEARGRLSEKDVNAGLKRVARKLEAIADELKDADRGRSGRAWRWAIDARVARRAAALKHAVREAGSMYVPDRIHAVRLALKKLRYGVELALESTGQKETSDVALMRQEQDLLGRLRDRQVLIERVRRVQGSLAPPDLAAWRELDALVTVLENSCRRLHARFVRDRSALLAVCDRLGARASAAAARRAG
jgi:CHAD domain-containing protein